MARSVEWTLEGSSERTRVGADGERTRYPADVHDCVCVRVDICQFEWYRDNISLLPSQDFPETVFGLPEILFPAGQKR